MHFAFSILDVDSVKGTRSPQPVENYWERFTSSEFFATDSQWNEWVIPLRQHAGVTRVTVRTRRELPAYNILGTLCRRFWQSVKYCRTYYDQVNFSNGDFSRCTPHYVSLLVAQVPRRVCKYKP